MLNNLYAQLQLNLQLKLRIRLEQPLIPPRIMVRDQLLQPKMEFLLKEQPQPRLLPIQLERQIRYLLIQPEIFG